MCPKDERKQPRLWQGKLKYMIREAKKDLLEQFANTSELFIYL